MKPHDVYRNLHNGLWSILDRKTGRVLKHQDKVFVMDALFIVRAGGRAKVLLERRKNVHAFVRGTVIETNELDLSGFVSVTYNPYKHSTFIQKETGESISASPCVIMLAQGMVLAMV